MRLPVSAEVCCDKSTPSGRHMTVRTLTAAKENCRAAIGVASEWPRSTLSLKVCYINDSRINRTLSQAAKTWHSGARNSRGNDVPDLLSRQLLHLTAGNDIRSTSSAHTIKPMTARTICGEDLPTV